MQGESTSAMPSGVTRTRLENTAATAARERLTQQGGKPGTFVLMSGAWHGEWCWIRVVERLRALGHVVYAPPWTGVGERIHLLTPDVDLATHVADIVNLLEYADLKQVILVGHSYGGAPVTWAADKLAHSGRIAHVVYLDAFAPENGKSCLDYIPESRHSLLNDLVKEKGQGYRIPPILGPKDLGVIDPTDAQWVASKLTDHPYKTFIQPVSLTGGINTLKRTYILCSTVDSRLAQFVGFANKAKAEHWGYAEIEGARHDAMITRPDDVVEILTGLL